MTTDPYTFVRVVSGRERQITIEPDLLTCWWSAFDGPQTPEGLVEIYSRTIDDLIAMKRTAGPLGDKIMLTSLDYEG